MTKLVVALSLALVATSFTSAADIALKDGRLLREAVVVKHDAATVTFRHVAGFTQIEKAKLPLELAVMYPLDTAKAELEAKQQLEAAKTREAEADRLYALRVQLAAASSKPAEVPAAEVPQPSADSTTWASSWIDTYNAESWRLMRRRDRDYNRDHDYVRDRHRSYDNRRDRDCPAPASRPSPQIQMTPDVHMTPNVGVMSVVRAPAPTQAEETEQPQPSRRSRF